MFNTHYSNINALWSALLVEELWRLGVRHCCIAPGSRSAPLTLMAAGHKGLSRHVHFDERGLGFYALGVAKSRREPVAIITTSGTAVANLYPALIEARQTGVPLIVITADRPPELIGCGANQAIEQQDIYSGYPGAVLNLPTPNEQISPNWVLTSIDQAFVRSCQQGLPLHINCQFREPLYPDGQLHDYSHTLSGTRSWLQGVQPHTTYQLPEPGLLSIPVQWADFIEGKGIVVAGRIEAGTEVEAVVRLSKTLGWPLVTDVQSQLHGHPEAVKHADLLLSNDHGRALMSEADRVFQIGGHLISKRLDQFLGQKNWKHYMMVDRESRRMDTAHRQTLRMVGSVAEFCQRLVEITPKQARWDNQLHEFADDLVAQISTALNDDTLTERWVCAHLGSMLPESTQLFIGNSLPIRLMDMFSATPLPYVFANRGASGIDGLMATAAGCCTGSELPTVMLVGDVSFLHDLNSLQLIRQTRYPMVVVLFNNDGGGIFNLLSMGSAADARTDYFVTPHGLNAQHVTSMFGLHYQAPKSHREFERALQQGLQQPAGTIIEVFTQPGEGADSVREMVHQVHQL
ncbi:2-succinyl-5-enolpyruvyl-6-hydroxy-3-cyclohexene-1-carboxylic-acid synthase [Endozoicomonas sp. (ex Bugula neritina AB1)]|nr:2-succinyl-5-enolpyruvyl-6-hydroxy-3-cyclohexene-1-carboxylic-acid synthase [Endozoicomonas sp. (ex Bugula neritina AB1)]